MTDGMDEDAGSDGATGPAAKPSEDAKPEKGSGGAGASIKAWADAVSALMKASLLLFAVAAVAAVAGAAIWREQVRRTIPVEIDVNAERLLREQGADIDLPATLIADLNANIGAIEKFIRTTLFDKVALIGGDPAVSLKPFGVDVTTSDVTRLYRSLFGEPDPYKLRMELLCPAGGCAPGKPVDPSRELTLLVELTGPGKGQRLSFRVPSSNPGLRRGLKAAMETASERLLEQIEPMIAALFYLNRPSTTIFPDEWQRYSRLAAAATTMLGPGAKARGCMASVVFYGSLSRRYLDAEGLDQVSAIGERADIDPTCRFAAKGTAAFWRMSYSMCSLDPRETERQFALAAHDMLGMDKLLAGAVPLERNEIVQRQIATDLIREANALIGADRGRRSYFCGFKPQAWDGRLAPADIGGLDAVAARIRQGFAAGRGISEIDALVQLMTQAARAIPRGALAERDRWASEIAELCEAYVAGDPLPRSLMSSWGQALRERGLTRIDAAALSDADMQASAERMPGLPRDRAVLLSSAQTFFKQAAARLQDASAMGSGTPLDGQSELEPIVSAADLAAAAGFAPEPQTGYARAVQSFVDRDEPPREILSVGRAASHWAALLSDEGACKGAPAADAQRQRTWAQLGASSKLGPCDALAGDHGADDLGLLALLRPVIRLGVEQCRAPAGEPYRPPGWGDPDLRATERMRCMDSIQAPEWLALLPDNTSTSVDDAITRAISRP